MKFVWVATDRNLYFSIQLFDTAKGNYFAAMTEVILIKFVATHSVNDCLLCFTLKIKPDQLQKELMQSMLDVVRFIST